MATFAELQAQAASLPQRIATAVHLGDAAKLAELQQEQSTLPTQLLFAELCELQEQLVDEQEEMTAAKLATKAAGDTVNELRAAVRAAQAALLAAEREAGKAKNREYGATENLRRIRNRIDEISAAQAYQAQAAAAPVVRNMIGRNHIPGPAVWPH